MSVASSAKVSKGGYYSNNITRGESGLDDNSASVRADFKDDDFGLLTDEHLHGADIEWFL